MRPRKWRSEQLQARELRGGCFSCLFRRLGNSLLYLRTIIPMLRANPMQGARLSRVLAWRARWTGSERRSRFVINLAKKASLHSNCS